MPVVQPDLKVTLSLKPDNEGLLLQDITGLYNILSNPLGLGLPGGPAVNDITGLVVTLTYESLSAAAVYTFTILNGVITGCTLAFAGGTPVSILSVLPSTVWPFVSTNPFEVTKNWATVILPDFADDVFKVSYEITGTSGGNPFDYTANYFIPVSVDTQNCVDLLFAGLDINCSCDSLHNAEMADASLKKFISVSKVGDLTTALQSLADAKKYCSCSCPSC